MKTNNLMKKIEESIANNYALINKYKVRYYIAKYNLIKNKMINKEDINYSSIKSILSLLEELNRYAIEKLKYPKFKDISIWQEVKDESKEAIETILIKK